MSAARVDINFEQGATFAANIAWKPDGTLIDTAGYTGRLQVRSKAGDPDLICEFTTSNGRITLGIVENYNIALSMTAADASAIAPESGSKNAVYDLELVNGGAVYRVMEGVFYIKPEVSV